MELWSFYFFAKIFLYYKDYIKFDVVWNLAFALFLIIPIPERLPFRGAAQSLRFAAAVVMAALLLWHDSWFPPPWEAAGMLADQGIPSREYILNFVMRYYNPAALQALGVIFAACYLANKFLRMSTLVLLCIVALAPVRVFGQPDSQAVTQSVDAFYDSELMRVTQFTPPASGAPDFDVVILHVCSLAWDDLKEVKMESNSFFRQFQLLFLNFNTTTSYSGPSVIRLMRANCGQARHSDLYTEAPRHCFLFPTLADMGYTTQAVLNHDGEYGHFTDEMKRFGKIPDDPIDVGGVPVQQRMFDNSSIHDDYHTLQRWWTQRQASRAPAVAVYYNTVTLHDGSHWAEEKEWWKRDRNEQYREFLTKLFQDLTRFMNALEESGRNVVVLFVPEHGLALRGSAIQGSGLRDIPLPRITLVPMGVRLIGEGFRDRAERQHVIETPVSYFALSHLLSRFIEKSPFGGEGGELTRAFLDTMPQTDFVAENQSARVVRVEGKILYYGKEGKWLEVVERERE